LQEQVEAPKIRFGFSRHHAPYEGTVSETGFKISRIIHYRNSFLPVIRGRFEPQVDGTTAIHIHMGVHTFVIAFLGFWCSIWFGISIPLALIGNLIGLIFICIATAILVGFWLAFWTEADRDRHALSKILLGETWEASDR
jgi:hypothetical protein